MEKYLEVDGFLSLDTYIFYIFQITIVTLCEDNRFD